MLRNLGSRFIGNTQAIYRFEAVRALGAARLSTWQPIEPTSISKRTSAYSNPLLARRFQTTFSNGQTTPRKTWFSTLGAALVGLGGAAFAFMKTDDFKTKNWFKVHCADKCGPKEKDCVEKKCGDSECLRKMDREEEIIAKANSDLEKALKDVKPKAMEYTEAALRAYCESYDLIQQFMDKAYCAIEDDGLESPRFEEVWCDVYDTAKKRCQKVKDAIQKGQCAWELLCRLREVIENGKNCKYTSCNPLLITAEEALLCAERELLNAKSKMDCIQSESIIVEQFKNVVEDFRRDLKAEVDSLVTGEECKGTFTENECCMILTHAYKKVLRVQKELAQVQNLKC